MRLHFFECTCLDDMVVEARLPILRPFLVKIAHHLEVYTPHGILLQPAEGDNAGSWYALAENPAFAPTVVKDLVAGEVGNLNFLAENCPVVVEPHAHRMMPLPLWCSALSVTTMRYRLGGDLAAVEFVIDVDTRANTVRNFYFNIPKCTDVTEAAITVDMRADIAAFCGILLGGGGADAAVGAA